MTATYRGKGEKKEDSEQGRQWERNWWSEKREQRNKWNLNWVEGVGRVGYRDQSTAVNDALVQILLFFKSSLLHMKAHALVRLSLWELSSRHDAFISLPFVSFHHSTLYCRCWLFFYETSLSTRKNVIHFWNKLHSSCKREMRNPAEITRVTKFRTAQQAVDRQ